MSAGDWHDERDAMAVPDVYAESLHAQIVALAAERDRLAERESSLEADLKAAVEQKTDPMSMRKLLQDMEAALSIGMEPIRQISQTLREAAVCVVNPQALSGGL